MADGESFEDVAHIAQIYEPVVGYTPVGQYRAEGGERVEPGVSRVRAGVGGHEGGHEDVRRGGADAADGGIERRSGLRCAFDKSGVGVDHPGVLSLDALAHHRDVGQE